MNKNVPLIIKPTINGIPVPDSKDVNLGTTDIYPPVHLLASVVTRLWKEKDSLKPISFDTGSIQLIIIIYYLFVLILNYLFMIK